MTQLFQVTTRAGLGYVTASKTVLLNGARKQQATSSSLRPYLGTGGELEIAAGWRARADLDWTQAAVAGQKFSVSQFSIGILVDL